MPHCSETQIEVWQELNYWTWRLKGKGKGLPLPQGEEKKIMTPNFFTEHLNSTQITQHLKHYLSCLALLRLL